MTRHRDGSVHVLLNRCTHRGAKVVNERKGHAHAAGLLLSRLDLRHRRQARHACRCRRAARPASTRRRSASHARRASGEYRGFVFASLADSGPSFEDHIGPMKGNIDDLVDRAPDGEIALDVGMHRYVYNGNWKLQIENVLDSYHVPFGHASTVNKDGVQFARREGDSKGAAVVETEKKQTAATWKDRKSFVVGNGHGWTSNTQLDDGKRSSPAFDEYKKALAAKVGAERAQQILTPRLHNTLIYPNMSIMGLNIHVRVIKPIAVDRTEVTIYPIRLVGAPDAMNFGNIRLLNVTHSAASFVQTDDLESFVRAQKGLRSDVHRLGRHLARARRRGSHDRSSMPRAGSPPTKWWCARSTRPGSATCARRRDGCSAERQTAGHRPRAVRAVPDPRGDSCSTSAASATGWRCSPTTAPTGCRRCPTRRARSTRPRCSTTTAS